MDKGMRNGKPTERWCSWRLSTKLVACVLLAAWRMQQAACCLCEGHAAGLLSRVAPAASARAVFVPPEFPVKCLSGHQARADAR